MKEIFGPGGLLSRSHPQYEFRPGQLEMAEAVARAIQEGHHLLVEAGTGTGKTLAYLIPAILSGKKVLISTGTKNLQEQLFFKDIPFLQQHLPYRFRASYMKGRSNYLCLFRFKRSETSPVLSGLDEIDAFDTVRKWVETTTVGDRAEIRDLPEDVSFWHALDARSEICLGQKCEDFQPCFITKMRQAALESQIVVVNHHLFFADLALRGNDFGNVLPGYDVVIFDEAHEMEDVATDYFGVSISNYRLFDLLRDAQAVEDLDPTTMGEIVKTATRASQEAERFWLALRALARFPEGRFALDRHAFSERASNEESKAAREIVIEFGRALERLAASLKAIPGTPPEAEALIRRTVQFRADLDFLTKQTDSSYVYWFEQRGRGIYLQASPIDVSSTLREMLFENVSSAVLTSATLTSAGDFQFIRSRLGIGPAEELAVPSHFDYRRQAILYLPPRMPDPRDPAFANAAVDEIVRIIEKTEGRAFVLFTSVQAMENAYEAVRQRVSFPCFVQGEASKMALLEKFKTTSQSVLFATSSFWQGVDVQGESLSCVIVDKLPFAVPTDPLVRARNQFIEENGGNPFYEYSVPQAIITLKQGLGRLIRSTRDTGVLAILDPRIRTKAYGRIFLRSLPPCPVTSSINDCGRVLARPASKE